METEEIVYPIILSGGYVATVKLPVSLDEADAEKVCRVVMALSSTQSTGNKGNKQ